MFDFRWSYYMEITDVLVCILLKTYKLTWKFQSNKFKMEINGQPVKERINDFLKNKIFYGFINNGFTFPLLLRSLSIYMEVGRKKSIQTATTYYICRNLISYD